MLHAVQKYEAELPDSASMIVDSGLPEATGLHEGLAKRLELEWTFFLGPKGRGVFVELFSGSEVGMFLSYEVPFGMIFVECAACGTPTVGANSGGSVDDIGVLRVDKALEEEWESKSRGLECPPSVSKSYSILASSLRAPTSCMSQCVRPSTSCMACRSNPARTRRTLWATRRSTSPSWIVTTLSVSP